MKIKFFFLFLLMGIFFRWDIFCNKDTLQNSLSPKIKLEKAIESGLQIDYQYKNQMLDKEIAYFEQQLAKMEKRFSIDLGGSYFFKSQQMEIQFPGFNMNPGLPTSDSKIVAGSKHNYDFKLSIIQPIYNGNILNNRFKITEQKILEKMCRIELMKINVILLIKSSYFTYLILKKKHQSLSLLLENLSLHRQRITNFFKEDLIKRSDVLETEIKWTDVKMKLTELNQLLSEEKIQFKKLSGFNIENIAEDYQESCGSFQESIDFYIAHHPILKTIDHNIHLLKLRKKIASGAYLPNLKGFAELHYGKPGIDFFKNQWALYFQVGLNINLRIFDWNQLKRKNKICDISINKLKNQKGELISETTKILKFLYKKKQTLNRQVTFAQQLIKLSNEDAALKNELNLEQQLPNIDYLSALIEKERYQSNLNQLILEIQLLQVNINSTIARYKENNKGIR